MDPENIILIEGLNKSFGDIKAVNDLSFRVKKGEFFAFLGVNGAGKSTTISVICGLLSKDSGKVIVCGHDIDRGMSDVKDKIGVVFQETALDKVLTVKDNLVSRGALYGLKGERLKSRIDELCDLLDIRGLLNRTVGKLSGGQRRRIDIARALIHSPELLILDEPTTGLDPQTRMMIWSIISRLREENGLTVFLTTHYMEEAAPADYVVILDSGRIAASGTPLELKNRYAGDYVTVYGIKAELAEKLAAGRKTQPVRDGWRIEVKNTSEAAELIVGNRELFKDFEITKGAMDDVFLAVTGKMIGKGE